MCIPQHDPDDYRRPLSEAERQICKQQACRDIYFWLMIIALTPFVLIGLSITAIWYDYFITAAILAVLLYPSGYLMWYYIWPVLKGEKVCS